MYRARRIVASLPSGVDRSVPVRRALRLFDRFRHVRGWFAFARVVTPRAPPRRRRRFCHPPPRRPPAPSVVGFTTSTGHFPCWTAYVGTVPTVHVLNPPTRFERPSTRRLTSVLSRKSTQSISNVRREVRRLLEAKQLRRAARIRVRGRERANGLLARGEIRRHVRVAQMSSSRFFDVVAVKDDDAIGRAATASPTTPQRNAMRPSRSARDTPRVGAVLRPRVSGAQRSRLRTAKAAWTGTRNTARRRRRARRWTRNRARRV